MANGVTKTDTRYNVGLRKTFVGLGERNFERSGLVQYKARRDNLNFQGVIYDFDDLLPFDVDDTSYSVAAVSELERLWEQEWLTPAE